MKKSCSRDKRLFLVELACSVVLLALLAVGAWWLAEYVYPAGAGSGLGN